MSKLIVGCGYLGTRVARRWLAAGQPVFAVTRSPLRALELQEQGVRPILADVTRPETLRGLPAAETVLYAVGFDPQSGASRQQVYVEGLWNVLEALSEETRRVIYVSSTGVYGAAGGAWVDEDSPCRPTRDAGRAMLAGEDVLRRHRLGDRGIILRLAGLYGPGRITRLNDLLAGRPLVAPAEGVLNLIHVEDAAEVVVAAEARAEPPRTYVVADGHPVGRREFYAHLGALLQREEPAFTEPPPEARGTLRSASDKRVNNRRMLAELHVELAYPSYREGLDAIVRGIQECW